MLFSGLLFPSSQFHSDHRWLEIDHCFDISKPAHDLAGRVLHFEMTHSFYFAREHILPQSISTARVWWFLVSMKFTRASCVSRSANHVGKRIWIQVKTSFSKINLIITFRILFFTCSCNRHKHNWENVEIYPRKRSTAIGWTAKAPKRIVCLQKGESVCFEMPQNVRIRLGKWIGSTSFVTVAT